MRRGESGGTFRVGGSGSGRVTTLPTALLQRGYSRELETEADDYAFQRLREIGLSPKVFAEIMLLLEEDRKKRSGGESRDYFSTHPATAKRVERALTAP